MRFPSIPTIVVVALLLLFAAQPAASHGEGGIPAQLDHMELEGHAHDALMTVHHGVQDRHHDNLSADHDGLAADHDAIDARLVSIQQRLDLIDVEAQGTHGAVFAGFESTSRALILVRVTDAGDGVGILDGDDFALATRVLPLGGCALVIDGVTSYGQGDYVLEVSPRDDTGCEWRVGDYLSSVVVTWGTKGGSALATVSVPSAPETSEQQADAAASTASSTVLATIPDA
jgi:hypothetical protein